MQNIQEIQNKNYSFRIYPQEKHKKKLYMAFDVCTDVWNTLLTKRNEQWKNNKQGMNYYDLNKLVSRDNGKKTWTDVFSQSLQNQAKRLDNAYKAFFRRCKEKAKEKGFPKLKDKTYSITFPDKHKVGYDLIGKRLYVSKIGMIPITLHRKIDGTIKTLTIKKLRSGEWYAIFSVAQPITNTIEKIDISKPVGIDLGLTNFAYLSDGTQYLHPKFLQKSEKRLKVYQRRVSRKMKGSVNRRKARFKLSRYHQYIDNQRKDYLHKLSHEIASRYTFIAVEDLNIKGMQQNHRLAKAIGATGWNSFVNMLTYKGNVFTIDRFEPTSCVCSNCSNKQYMDLSNRIFTCNSCGLTLDRDYNASINILKSALRKVATSNLYVTNTKQKHNQLNDTVGNTEIKTLVENEALLSNPKDKVATSFEETRNTSGNNKVSRSYFLKS